MGGSEEEADFSWADGSLVHDTSYAASLASERLYNYLSRNTTAEYPQDTQLFKLVLEPNQELAETSSNVFTVDENGELVPHPLFADVERVKVFKGTAYRQVVLLTPHGELMYSFKPVGWARITVHDDQQIEGAWKVDDEEGLGIPAAIYHINRRYMFEALSASSSPEIHEHEQALLANLQATGNELVVWRDADMHPTMFKNLDLLDDDSSYATLFKKRSKVEVECDPELESSPCYDPELHTRQQLHRRAGQNNDTGSNGFSSGVNLANFIGDTSGCPSHRRIGLMGLAGDCNFLQTFPNASSAREYIIDMVNTASQVYETSFNVTLGISALVLVNNTVCDQPDNPTLPWNYDCSINPSSAMSDRLSKFSQWRGTRPADDGIAAWTLMTSCTQSSVVGLAWMGLLCRSGSAQMGDGSFVSNTNVVAKTSLGWRVYAHEVGHSFGAVHDCTSETCAQGLAASSECCPLSRSTCDAGGTNLMNPASGVNQDTFSACTIGNVCNAIGRMAVNSTCLSSNSKVSLITTNECGNGIVEEGEECDCGGPMGCGSNNCCDPLTCKFKPGAVCDDSNEVCCNQCQFSSSTTVCKASTGPCDFDQFCPGNSSSCPAPKVKDDGTSCSLNGTNATGLRCISGHCTSRDLQCMTLLANTTISFRGLNLNPTQACADDSSCVLSCIDPNFGNVCFSTSQNFLDGTPCRGSGRCQTGRCIGGRNTGFGGGRGGGGESVSSWFSRNKNVVIAIAVSVGSLLVILIAFGFYRNYRQKRASLAAAKRVSPVPLAGQPPLTGQYYPRPPPPPPPAYPAQSYEMGTYYPRNDVGQEFQRSASDYDSRPRDLQRSDSVYSPPPTLPTWR